MPTIQLQTLKQKHPTITAIQLIRDKSGNASHCGGDLFGGENYGFGVGSFVAPVADVAVVAGEGAGFAFFAGVGFWEFVGFEVEFIWHAWDWISQVKV